MDITTIIASAIVTVSTIGLGVLFSRRNKEDVLDRETHPAIIQPDRFTSSMVFNMKRYVDNMKNGVEGFEENYSYYTKTVKHNSYRRHSRTYVVIVDNYDPNKVIHINNVVGCASTCKTLIKMYNEHNPTEHSVSIDLTKTMEENGFVLYEKDHFNSTNYVFMDFVTEVFGEDSSEHVVSFIPKVYEYINDKLTMIQPKT